MSEQTVVSIIAVCIGMIYVIVQRNKEIDRQKQQFNKDFDEAIEAYKDFKEKGDGN